MIRRALAVLALVCLTACGSATVRATHVAVVTLGAAVTSLRAANAEVYRTASDRLIADLAHDGGTPADYDRLVAPLTRAFLARSDAVAELDAALYAAAGINDAVRAGGSPASVRGAARRVLAAADRLLADLASGAVLAPVAIPPEVRGVLAALRGVAGDDDAGTLPEGDHDGGHD